LVIPVIIIWKIRIRLAQKIAISLTLCLTTVMIAISIVRIAMLERNGKLDLALGTYLIAIEAETGLTLVAATAFRTLYVSKAKIRPNDTIDTFHWYHRSVSAVTPSNPV